MTDWVTLQHAYGYPETFRTNLGRFIPLGKGKGQPT